MYMILSLIYSLTRIEKTLSSFYLALPQIMVITPKINKQISIQGQEKRPKNFPAEQLEPQDNRLEVGLHLYACNTTVTISFGAPL